MFLLYFQCLKFILRNAPKEGIIGYQLSLWRHLAYAGQVMKSHCVPKIHTAEENTPLPLSTVNFKQLKGLVSDAEFLHWYTQGSLRKLTETYFGIKV